MNEVEQFGWILPILPLLSAVFLVLVAGVLLAPVLACVTRGVARKNGVKTIPFIDAAYSIAVLLPWFYLMARINNKNIPHGITIALYTALYALWIVMIGLYIIWAFNAIEYNYSFEEGRPHRAGIGIRTTIAFIAVITACCVTFAYSFAGLLSEQIALFFDKGNKVKRMLVPTNRDALPYALCALWIPLLFSTGNFGYMTMLAIGFVVWRVFCSHGGPSPANAGRRAFTPDWREALPFGFFATWILMALPMWLISYGILNP